MNTHYTVERNVQILISLLKHNGIRKVIASPGHTFLAAVNATGKVVRYQIWVSVVGVLVFPLSLVAFKAGCPPQTAFYIYFLVYFVLIFVRLFIVTRQIGMPRALFAKEVFLKIIPVTIFSAVVPLLLMCGLPPSIWRLLAVCVSSVLCVAVSVYLTGLTAGEKIFIVRKLRNIFKVNL